MKTDMRKLKGSAGQLQMVHSIKVDLHKLKALEPYQIPERSPNRVLITKQMMELLEEQPPARRPGIKVDYRRMEELGICSLAAGCRAGSSFKKCVAMAACLLLTVGLSIFSTRLRIYATGAEKPADEPIPVTRIEEAELQDVTAGITKAGEAAAAVQMPDITFKESLSDAAEAAELKEPKPVSAEAAAVEETPQEEPVITEEPLTASSEPMPAEKPVTADSEPVAEETVILDNEPVPAEEPAAMEASVQTEAAAYVPETAEEDGEWVSLGNDWTITYYCPLSCCNGSHAWCTSTGAPMQVGRTIAVDPSVIPYYSHVRIEGLDCEYVAEDCGGAIKGKKIDVLVDNCEVARQMGRNKNVEVWVRK